MEIVVEYIYPSIPVRTFDYCATYEDHDLESPQGYGATAIEAVRDFLEKVEDMQE